MHKASLETFNFYFEAYGASKDDALLALELGIEKHCRQYKISLTGFLADFADSIFTMEIKPDVCYRDYETI